MRDENDTQVVISEGRVKTGPFKNMGTFEYELEMEAQRKNTLLLQQAD